MPRKSIEQFRVEYLQVLDPEGNVDPELDPHIPHDDLRRMYRAMLLARMVDRRMVSLQQQGRMGTFPQVLGQEGGCVGCVYALKPNDWLVPSFRETSALFFRGVHPKYILMYYMGLEEGNSFIEGENMLPIPIAVGAQAVHATGIALAAKNRGDKAVTLCFFGDGATSEGEFHEAMNLAGVFQVPAVFVCNNNQFAISVPQKVQTRAETYAQKAIAYGFPGIQIDGNDALASYVASKEAVERARSGGGPTLIESVTYRMCPHTTADDPRRYRREEEVQEWSKKDPILRFQRYLSKLELWDQTWQERLEEEFKAEIEDAVQDAEATLHNADPLEIFDHVYSDPPPDIQAQKEQAAASLGEPTHAGGNGRA